MNETVPGHERERGSGERVTSIPGPEMVPSAWVLGIAAHDDDLSGLDQASEACSNGARSAPNLHCDLPRRSARQLAKDLQDGRVDRVDLWCPGPLPPKRNAEPASNLLQLGLRQPGLAASGDHALDPAAPLLNQLQFVEHPPDDAVSEFADPSTDVFDGQSGRQVARIVDLDAIREDRETQGGTSRR